MDDDVDDDDRVTVGIDTPTTGGWGGVDDVDLSSETCAVSTPQAATCSGRGAIP